MTTNGFTTRRPGRSRGSDTRSRQLSANPDRRRRVHALGFRRPSGRIRLGRNKKGTFRNRPAQSDRAQEKYTYWRRDVVDSPSRVRFVSLAPVAGKPRDDIFKRFSSFQIFSHETNTCIFIEGFEFLDIRTHDFVTYSHCI